MTSRACPKHSAGFENGSAHAHAVPFLTLLEHSLLEAPRVDF